jgi:hypothetical protein
MDDRSDARADVLWDGDHLYVVSGGPQEVAGDALRLGRFSYEAATRSYVPDPGYPVTVTETGVKRPTIARDSAGSTWIAYVLNNRVWLNRVDGHPPVVAEPLALPNAARLGADDVAAVLAYGDRVGVLWSNQAEEAFYFASHADSDPPELWSTPRAILEGPGAADNHITARALDGPDGPTVYAVVKTSIEALPDHDSSDPQLVLLELRPDDSVREHVFGRVEDEHTRPLLIIDEQRRELYVFAVSPLAGGSVVYKRTSADDIRPPPGPGEPFLQGASGQITSPTASKQNVTSETDLGVLASRIDTNRYVFGVLDLGSNGQ